MKHQGHLTPEDEEDSTASPEFSRLLFIGFGIAALIGLLCGVVWIAWHLLVR